MALEFAERIRRIPVYPVAAGYDLGDDVAMLASNETASRRSSESSRPPRACWRAPTAIPTPPISSYARRWLTATGWRGSGSRLAPAPATSCAAGEALLEPGAEVVYAWPAFSVYPHLAAASGARAIEVPLDSAAATTSTRCAPRSRSRPGSCWSATPTTRPRPRCARGDRGVPQQIPPHVCVILDEAYCEFSLTLGDPFASRRLLDRYPNLVMLRLSRRSTGSPGCASATASAAPTTSGPPSTRSASRSTSRRSAGGGGRGPSPPGRGRAPRRPRGRRARDGHRGLRELGLWVAESDANFLWVRLPRRGDDGPFVAA